MGLVTEKETLAHVLGSLSSPPLTSDLPVRSVFCIVKAVTGAGSDEQETCGFVVRPAGEEVSDEELLGMLRGYVRYARDELVQRWLSLDE